MASEQVIASLAEKLLGQGERLLVVCSDEAQVARLDRVLWDLGASSFLPHDAAGGAEDSRQPVLLSTNVDPSNAARNLLIADGEWREAALGFNRAFYLFDEQTLDEARAAWRSLAKSDDAESHYWANENGRWAEKASSRQTA